MHIIYDIKIKIAPELAGFGFWQLNSSWQLNFNYLSTAQNDFSNFQPGWWQFCWITGVKFNSIQSIIVWLLHIAQFTLCATKNLTVLLPIHHDVSSDRAWLPYREPCVSCQQENLFYWNAKIKCKEYFSYPMSECQHAKTRGSLVPDCTITYHTCQHTVGSRSSKTS